MNDTKTPKWSRVESGECSVEWRVKSVESSGLSNKIECPVRQFPREMVENKRILSRFKVFFFRNYLFKV